ncbi:MAG: hypothetical protein IMF19_11915 [Proteobacteria bacterium]|jgi:hypothetical protein|nr:hypothetical protein [Pseudomonadota bacterium]
MESAVVKLPDISAEKGSLREIFKAGAAREVIEAANEADIRKEEILERDKINGGICTKFGELH